MVSLLDSSRSLWFTKRPIVQKTHSTKVNITLPIEIWTMIIHYVLYSGSIPDTYCQPMLASVNGQRLRTHLGKPHEWCSLRLVCHAWAQITGPHDPIYGAWTSGRFYRMINKPEVGRLVCLRLRSKTYEDLVPLLLDNSSNLQSIRSLTLETRIWRSIPDF